MIGLEQNIKVWKNGILIIEDHNTLHNDFRQYMADLLQSPVDRAINDLFTVDDETSGGSEDGKDGILVHVSTRGERTMITTSIAATETYGAKWQGKYTNVTGGSEDVLSFTLGHDFDNTTSPYFTCQYADYNPATTPIDDQDIVIIEWEIYLTS